MFWVFFLMCSQLAIIHLPGNLVVNSKVSLDGSLPPLTIRFCLDCHGVVIRSWEAVLVLQQLHR